MRLFAFIVALSLSVPIVLSADHERNGSNQDLIHKRLNHAEMILGKYKETPNIAHAKLLLRSVAFNLDEVRKLLVVEPSAEKYRRRLSGLSKEFTAVRSSDAKKMEALTSGYAKEQLKNNAEFFEMIPTDVLKLASSFLDPPKTIPDTIDEYLYGIEMKLERYKKHLHGSYDNWYLEAAMMYLDKTQKLFENYPEMSTKQSAERYRRYRDLLKEIAAISEPKKTNDENEEKMGRYAFPNGDRYIGNFLDGKRHGFGLYLSSRGHRYEGQWVDDARHGKGEIIYAEKMGRYSGIWSNNLKDGHGTFIYPNGDRYEGRWKNDTKHGYGVYFYHGGDRYEGEFFANNMHGQGVLVVAGGDTLVGRWKDDNIHGRCILTKASGERVEEVYEEGTMISQTPFSPTKNDVTSPVLIEQASEISDKRLIVC
eukprot:430528_1